MNYHLFVVDTKSFSFHLEYGFVGIGKSSNAFDIKLWKDIARLKRGDKIVFYVQGLKKFYGFFEVISEPFFDNENYLQPDIMPYLGKNNDIRLQYRALIQPFQVFQFGIEEFNLIDILPERSNDILWSILYRKLKGRRGCSPLFEREFNIILEKMMEVNDNQVLNGNSFTFNNSEIVSLNQDIQYRGNTDNIPDIKQNILNNNFTEHHLHALLISYLNQNNNVSWLGNEVYSGAGMQAMDILFINNRNVFNIIEVKRDEIPNNITLQIKKYISWLKNRFRIFDLRRYQPIIIGGKINGQRQLNNRIQEFIDFNHEGISLPIRYIEYEILNNNIVFQEIIYNNGNFHREILFRI